MSPEPDLKSLSSHFAFGENWASYAKQVGEKEIAEAERGLLQLIPENELHGKSFLDIGCGSGLHLLAAARLGAAKLFAIDIDPNSVATARRLFERFAPTLQPDIRVLSIFNTDPGKLGQFDIVYSWGVLHHTGAMIEALTQASRLVSPGGLFAFALYRKTRLCWVWTWEKRWYGRANPRAQRLAQSIYIGLMRLAFLVSGRDFKSYVRDYVSQRGMDYRHDVHDWLGGYPYESITPSQVEELMERLGFDHLRSNTRPLSLGLFGSGCDEYVYRRRGG